MALIGATTVTVLTYVNMPLGLTSMAIILLIGAYVCRDSLASTPPGEINYRFHYDWPNPAAFNLLRLQQNFPPQVPFVPFQPPIPWNPIPLANPHSSTAAAG